MRQNKNGINNSQLRISYKQLTKDTKRIKKVITKNEKQICKAKIYKLMITIPDEKLIHANLLQTSYLLKTLKTELHFNSPEEQFPNAF